jgi:signal transduction histidine kinase
METIPPEFPAEGFSAEAEPLPPDIHARLVAESYARTAVVAPIIGGSSIVLGGLSWLRIESPWLLAWIATSVVITVVRLMLVRGYRRGGGKSKSDYWARVSARTSWIAAVHMCLVAPVFVLVGDPMVHALIGVMMFTCIPSGAVPRRNAPPNSGAWQFRLVLGALAAGLAATGDHNYIAIATVVAAIAIALPMFLRRSYVERLNALASAREKAALLAQLVSQKADAEAASRAKSAFLASMSHELRTPLNAIIGFSDLIRLEMFGPIGNDRYRTYIEDIASSGKHLLALINDVLDMSKIEVGRMVLHEEETDLSDLARHCCESVRLQAAAGRVTLACNTADAHWVFGDPQRFRQILLNLLSNAIKYTGEEGRVTVTVAVDATGATLLEVEDTGVGIAPEDLATVMEMFGQIESDINRTKPGTGLGLPLTQRLVQLHGGTLSIDSEPGRGTRVTARFPVERTLSVVSARSVVGGR